MKLTMLGTGNAQVTECYNTCFVLQDHDKYFMVDAGGGNTVLAQLKKAGLDWKDMRHIFITHKHVDHIMGAVWMMRMICQNMSRKTYDGEAAIYGHEEVIRILRTIASLVLQPKETAYIDDRLHMVVLEDGDEKEIMGHKVRFFDIHSTKAKQFGFSMELDSGKVLTCCGDEPYNKENEEYVKDCGWLLHEAFCLHSQADIFHPYEKSHSTAKDAGQLAEELKVPNLVLYHTEDRTIATRKETYTAEAQSCYSGNLYVPDDLETIEII